MPLYSSTTGRKLYCNRNQMRRCDHLPYGKWICTDGREVLFHRFYEPIWQRYPGAAPTAADRGEWIPWEAQSWFYNDGHVIRGERSARVLAMKALVDFGLAAPQIEEILAIKPNLVLQKPRHHRCA
jgi:hypothetical protein